MIYNRTTKKTQKATDCSVCQYYDRRYKKCNGIGKNCFEYDDKTMLAVDPVTKLTINLRKLEG